jgi:hypothetical protein
MLYIKPENMKAWSIVIIAFSMPSVITGGGFIIGIILGTIGGVSALRKPSINDITPSPEMG